jgi:hypothetical protein
VTFDRSNELILWKISNDNNEPIAKIILDSIQKNVIMKMSCIISKDIENMTQFESSLPYSQ